MYVCPNCHEQIPDRVKKSQDACPFCHEPWPPEESPVEEEASLSDEATVSASQASVPATVGSGATGSPSHAAAAEPESRKSHLGVIIAVILVLVAVGGFFGYRAMKGSKKTKAGGITVKIGTATVSVKGLQDEEFEQLVKWHDEIRKAMVGYFSGPCDEYRQHRFHVTSSLVERERLITATKKEKKVELNVEPGTGSALPLDGFNWFRCPVLLAYVDKEHRLTIDLNFTEKERVLGSTIRMSTITIGGGRFVVGKGVYRSFWDQNRRGLSFPQLKKTAAKKFPGILALSGKKIISKGRKKMNFAGIDFVRIKREHGKSFLDGHWRATLATNKFHKILKGWSDGCISLKRSIRAINKKYDDKSFKIPELKQQALALVQTTCKAMAAIAGGVEPWNQTAVDQGREELAKALGIAQKNVRGPLEMLGAKLKNDMRPKAWCGGLDTPSVCKK
ncbi:MAG: hypothetical protein J7M25_12685 [Deltaproteobacteria bacterium]|nr:hypothetical protein [Deltaproteobacteria bacterium]